MEVKKREKKVTPLKCKILVRGKKINEMEIKASLNTCCTWMHSN